MFDTLKPVLSALVQPPGGLLLLLALALIGTARGRRLARWSRMAAFAALAGLWLIGCSGTAQWLQDRVLRAPAALTEAQWRALVAQDGSAGPTALVVLGGGRHGLAAEYALADLTDSSLVRLRYGVWLARRTGWPLAYSGGVGWAQEGGASEAEVAARIARDELGLPLRWQEGASRDTRQNARLTVPLLQADGVRRIVLVTHASHMPRALKVFREAAPAGLTIVAAPLAHVGTEDRRVLAWLPSAHGLRSVHALLHECLGLLAGV
jgi:uncharacterized SAM-binding protein YcdF (DUF218 family)